MERNKKLKATESHGVNGGPRRNTGDTLWPSEG